MMDETLPDSRIASVADSLYALLPAHIRHRDIVDGKGALRALMGVLALASTEIDLETADFYDSLFVETAPAAGLAAIAALVAAPDLAPMPGKSGPARAYVANTIRYRRGKGTARVIEALAADVTGLGAVAIEYFQRLSRLNHLIDLRSDRPGFANLISGQTGARVGTGFDLLPRLADLRAIQDRRLGRPAGRHGISALGVHLLRPVAPVYPAPVGDTLPLLALSGVPQAQPWVIGGAATLGYFQLAAQPGGKLTLFNPDRRDRATDRRVAAADLPDRLRRLPLHLETDALRRADIDAVPVTLPESPAWYDDQGQPFTIFLRRGVQPTFTRVPPARILIANLETPPQPLGARPAPTLRHSRFIPDPTQPPILVPSHPILCTFDPVTGRLITPAPIGGQVEVTEVRIAYATGHGLAIGAGAHDRNDNDQPFEVRNLGADRPLIRRVNAAGPTTGLPADDDRQVKTLALALAEVAAVGAKRRSLILLTSCDVEAAPGTATQFILNVPPESEVFVIAADWRTPTVLPGLPADPDLRGYILRRERRFTLSSLLTIRRKPGLPALRAGRVVLDGIEAILGVGVATNSVSDLLIRHCTLRNPAAVALKNTGPVTNVAVRLDQSICGPVIFTDGMTGDLTITGSVVGADGGSATVLAAPALACTLCDTTILGAAKMREVSATNTIFAETAAALLRQSGCLRYSFAPQGSQLPRAFRCQPDLAIALAAAAKGADLTAAESSVVEQSVQPVFLDTGLDEPGLAMLHALCPDAIRTGGESQSEMGAFSTAAYGIATTNLTSLFSEYLPLALGGAVLDDTRTGAIANWRNRP